MTAKRSWVIGIDAISRNAAQADHHPSDPFAGLLDVGQRMNLAGITGGLQVGTPESSQVGHQTLDTRTGAGHEFLRLAQADAHQQGAGIVIGTPADLDAGHQPGLETVDVRKFGRRLSPAHLDQANDRRSHQGWFVGEMAIQPGTGNTRLLRHIRHRGCTNPLVGQEFLGSVQQSRGHRVAIGFRS
ncbi:Uncharacterised protein [Mycobacteroides abscessus subsp. abscessus]|nr:Uncharacterised protein [Mycobacteroides abscessus subsp. abscessus]